jgi:hypothetical protein
VLLRRLANPHLPPLSPQPTDLVELDVITGKGSDDIDVRLESAAGEVEQKVRIDSGAGGDRVQVNIPAVQRDGIADLIVGAGQGAVPHVKVFDGATPVEVQNFFAFDPRFTGGVRAARGDVNGDGMADIITGAGPGAPGGHVKVFDGRTHAELASFFAFDPNFLGGVFVAAGDVNGDGRDDIITGADGGAAGGHVKVFDGPTGVEIRSLFAFDPGFTGGVRVAAGDVNGDGLADIITGAGSGAPGGHVKVFDGRTGSELASFFAFDPNFTGGIFVAAGDINGDGRDDIITGADVGAAGGHVKVFSGATGAEIRSFFAFDPGFAGGVRVAAGDVNGDGFADIITAAGPGAPGGHVQVFDGRTLAELASFFAFDPNFTGGVFVAAADLHSSRQPRQFDLDLAIDTAGGNDEVEVFLGASASESLNEQVRVVTGSGADRASVIWQKLRLTREFPGKYTGDHFIDSAGGNDEVQLAILPFIEQDNIFKLRVDLGAGEDLAKYWVFGTELPRARGQEPMLGTGGQFELQFVGGVGNDNIQGQIGSDPSGQFRPLTLGSAKILIDGGAGRDRLSLDFRGPILEGTAVDAVLRGGAGNDQVRARFDLDPASKGQLLAQVLGDDGNDELGLAVLHAENLDLLFALLDGGKGKDRCRTTPNVIVQNCR